MDQLHQLAVLIQQRNALDREISAILGRPLHSGHFGEFVAAAIFGVRLNPSASAKRHDGYFMSGPLAGKTVNIKYGTKRDGLLNLATSISESDHPDFYLVLTGPQTGAVSSRGTFAPWVIDAVFLFETSALLTALRDRGIRPGTATSVRVGLWDAAMIFPDEHCPQLTLTGEQKDALALFAGNRI